MDNKTIVNHASIMKAAYSIGDVIYHKQYDFRGVIVDVDAKFEGDEEWYNEEADYNPRKDAPWYHVLVDEESTMAYVSEKSISYDFSKDEIIHPMINDVFVRSASGKYTPRQSIN